TQIEQLEPSRLEALMEALLDFEQLDDLENWLAEQAQRDGTSEAGSETA
ncbi:MAG: DUF4351 domain-containing protein, partial [Cyanothece sp. SIO1E1]|nr:DUF4351 domain-containing protein [Cyanothece sp. SIO1E1]